MRQHRDIFSIIHYGTNEEYFEAIADADFNIVKHGQNLLQESIACNKPDIAADLIKRGIDLNFQDGKAMTVLHYCANYGALSTALLLIQYGANIDIIDNFGNQPLWYAVFKAQGKYDLVKLLVENGADCGHKNNAGRSPLDFAKQINDTELVDLLSQ